MYFHTAYFLPSMMTVARELCFENGWGQAQAKKKILVQLGKDVSVKCEPISDGLGKKSHWTLPAFPRLCKQSKRQFFI
jgi:hypothetical protein